MTSSAGDSASCDFCAIGRGDDPSVEVVCEGTDWVAFFPLHPATPGHSLIIPRGHVPDLSADRAPTRGRSHDCGDSCGDAIDTALAPEGMNLITSAGQIAEQTVFHLHLHVVPRWRRDGFGDIWPPAGRYEDADLRDVADRIRGACADAT